MTEDTTTEDNIEKKPTGFKKAIARSHKLPDGSVKPFPLVRFLKFVKVLRVQTRDYGLVPLELLGSQLYVLDEIVKGMKEGITTFVILKARQLGISTLFLALDLFWAFEHEGLLGIFATHDEGSRDQFRNQIDVFLKTLPDTHKVNVNIHNRTMLVLKNSSLFRYLVAGMKATTNKMGRSGGCNFLHATEVAFWGSVEDIKSLGQTLSELYKHRLYFYESTANGFNHYADMWEVAMDSPAQMAIFVGWWRDERNEFSSKHPLYLKYMPQGTETPLTTLERERIKIVKKLYGFKITAGQIAWYRFHLETKCGNDQSAMDQEMPWTADDAFVSTGKSFFTNQVLTQAFKEARQFLCSPYMLRLTNNFRDTRLVACDIKNAELKIWEKPKAGAKYVVGADPIFGSSGNRANGVISVFRCYADCCEQVAEYTTSSISAYQYAWALAFICGLYDDVTLQLEMTGPGGPVYEEMGQLRQKLQEVVPDSDDDMRNCLLHMKNYLYRRVDSLSGGALLQWQTTPSTRPMLLHKFHDGMLTRRILLRSLAAIEECKNVTIQDDGDIDCPAGKRDDRVFGAAFAYWCWDKSVRPQMLADKLTKANVLEREEKGVDQISNLVQRFLKDANISVRQ